MSRPRRPALPMPPDPPRGQGIFDPAYLLAEIQELQAIAERAEFGTLAYLLEMAAIEAKAQVRQLREESGGAGGEG